ncbi:MAG TPA: hypothetical protein VLA93_07400 [Pyrinomonadaceae bacterium]|nr:hypothetical protein [Pyrinomonadaceae bacterium]
MPLPRRSFLKKGVLSAISAGLMLGLTRAAVGQTQHDKTTTPQTAATMPLAAQTDPVFQFSAATFKPYVGSIFTAPNALGERIPMTLISLKEFTPKQPSRTTSRFVKTESFSLTFKADAELPPFTSIHKINHPALGDFSLFLTNRIADNGDRLYDAVINHLP